MFDEHEIGENEKDRAIDALRGVQNSIEKILLTEDQAAVIKTRVGEMEGMVEPEIVVADETARQAPPPQAPPAEAPVEETGEAAAEEPKGPEE